MNKQCSNPICLEHKPIEEFDFQVNNPTKRYAWCNACRAASKGITINLGRQQSYANEVKELRNKAKQLRKIQGADVARVKEMRQAGMSLKQIGAEFNCSASAVSTALKFV